MTPSITRVRKGAIYSLKGGSRPAAELANKHGIQLVTGTELAERAEAKLNSEELNRILDDTSHRCPRCEAPMVLRKGDFDPFWGCSTYPRCRGTIKAD